MKGTYANLILNELQVITNCILPKDTSIGDVSGSELIHMQGVRDNLQKQLDSLSERIGNIETRLTDKEET
jgi:hypothetical protein